MTDASREASHGVCETGQFPSQRPPIFGGRSLAGNQARIARDARKLAPFACLFLRHIQMVMLGRVHCFDKNK